METYSFESSLRNYDSFVSLILTSSEDSSLSFYFLLISITLSFVNFKSIISVLCYWFLIMSYEFLTLLNKLQTSSSFSNFSEAISRIYVLLNELKRLIFLKQQQNEVTKGSNIRSWTNEKSIFENNLKMSFN